jgi:hypothetical protein
MTPSAFLMSVFDSICLLALMGYSPRKMYSWIFLRSAFGMSLDSVSDGNRKSEAFRTS